MPRRTGNVAMWNGQQGKPTETRELIIPAQCSQGHALTPMTVHVRVTGACRNSPGGNIHGWECVACLRVDLWRAHYGRNAPVPEDVLTEDQFGIQKNAQATPGRLAVWCERVLFLADKQFSDYPLDRTKRAAA